MVAKHVAPREASTDSIASAGATAESAAQLQIKLQPFLLVHACPWHSRQEENDRSDRVPTFSAAPPRVKLEETSAQRDDKA